ncbi:MAG: HAD-IIIA family hydrolase [Candidatus Hodarchaeales archaeon]|jgi:N-acylneuraminate cytidylyltransferase
MINGKKIVALIPLRGGSRSIPKKNIKPIAGKPLCVWVLESAKAVKEIDEVYVSTEDEEISKTVLRYDSKIRILNRPPEFATDDASTESVMFHFSENVEFDYLITIQATSPLTTSEDIRNGLKKVISESLNSLVTGVRTKRFFWDSGWIMENGAFYITDRETLISTQCRLGGKIGILEMPEETSIEIDELNDWKIVEKLLNDRKTEDYKSKIKNIKLLVVDVDGTLTDGGMYYSEKGELLKKFNTRDAKGLELIRKEGITVVILTSENSSIVKARSEKLKLEHVYLGITEKSAELEKICVKMNLTLSEVAYIGDDINDLPALMKVGFSACPSDAVTEIRDVATFICQSEGGKGAVREVCDLLLNKK